MRAIVENPVYAGVAAYGRRVTGNGHAMKLATDWITTAVPPLVTPTERQTAIDAMARRRLCHAPRKTTAEDPFLARGLLSCDACGGGVVAVTNGPHRYYICQRSVPSVAVRINRPHHAMARVPAEAMENLARHAVVRALATEQYRSIGIEEARRAHDAATERQRGRVAAIDAEIARLRRILDRATAERLGSESGSEADQSLKRTMPGSGTNILFCPRQANGGFDTVIR